MADNKITHKRDDGADALTRLPNLAGPLLRFNLQDELRQLRQEDSWQHETGRSSKTLAKYPDFRLVLVLMKASTQMKEHHADGRLSIQMIKGILLLCIADQKVELSAGEMMVLDYGIPHDVEALKESAFLITISWPGRALEERHTGN